MAGSEQAAPGRSIVITNSMLDLLSIEVANPTSLKECNRDVTIIT